MRMLHEALKLQHHGTEGDVTGDVTAVLKAARARNCQEFDSALLPPVLKFGRKPVHYVFEVRRDR